MLAGWAYDSSDRSTGGLADEIFDGLAWRSDGIIVVDWLAARSRRGSECQSSPNDRRGRRGENQERGGLYLDHQDGRGARQSLWQRSDVRAVQPDVSSARTSDR